MSLWLMPVTYASILTRQSGKLKNLTTFDPDESDRWSVEACFFDTRGVMEGNRTYDKSGLASFEVQQVRKPKFE